MSNLDIIKTIFTEFPYALIGSVLVGSLCAYLGVYVVSKRIVFVGATLTQVAVTGIAFAHLPFIDMNPLFGSILFTLLIVLLLPRLLNSRSVPRDSMLGIIFVSVIAFRILMIQKSPAAEVSEIESILKGDILMVTGEQLYLMLSVFILIMAIHLLFYKEFIFVSLDAETAATQGFRAHVWELLFYLTVGITISVATRIVGDVFVFSFLIIPAVAAMLFAKRVFSIFVAAMVFGIISPIIGLYLAFVFDFPAGPTAVATVFIILIISWIISRIKR